jgi:P4 family phage/plasmid primase-like protien
MDEITNVEFYYYSRYSYDSTQWSVFVQPYSANEDIINNLDSVIKTFSTDFSSIVPYNVEAISKAKYLANERLDTKIYKYLCYLYPDVDETPCTISDVMRSNPDFMKKYLFNEINNGVITLDTCARILMLYLNDNIISTTDRKFYIFSGIWNLDINNGFLNRVIMNDLLNFLLIFSNDYNLNDYSKNIYMLFDSKREDIILRLSYLCESKTFTDMLDDKVNIIAFKNGVYDFNNHIFRDSIPNDYLSIKTNINYNPNPDPEQIQALISMLSSIFPDKDVLDFFIETLSLVMGGRNYEKIILVWLGKTDTGKSTCQEFIEYVLGDYCGSLPSSMFVGKRNNPHGTTSALSSIGSKRLLFIQEPEEAKINSSQLKSLSGNDTLYMREIYQKSTTSRIKAITVLVTNGNIDLSACDEASLSRLVVVPFLSSFVTSRLNNKSKFSQDKCTTADINFKDKLKPLSSAMLHLLVQRFNTYLDQGFIIPDLIRRHTQEFIMNSNPILYYLNKYLEESLDAILSIDILYSSYLAWFRETHPSTKSVSRPTFVSIASSSGFNIKGSYLSGYRFMCYK